MSTSVLGAFSKQIRHLRDLYNNCHEESKEGILKDQQCDIKIIVEDPNRRFGQHSDLSIKSHHEKVELELKEKQKKIALLKEGSVRRPKDPTKEPTTLTCKSPEGPWNSWSSWSTSHPLTITCVVCAYMIPILGAIFILVVLLRRYLLDIWNIYCWNI